MFVKIALANLICWLEYWRHWNKMENSLFLFVINLKPPCEFWKISRRHREYRGSAVRPIFSTTFSFRILQFSIRMKCCRKHDGYVPLTEASNWERDCQSSTTGRVKPRQSSLKYLWYFSRGQQQGARETMKLEFCQPAWAIFLTQQISYQEPVKYSE